MRWEYKIVNLTMPGDFNLKESEPIKTERMLRRNQKRLSELGSGGWECFHVVGKAFYFKRPDPRQRKRPFCPEELVFDDYGNITATVE